MEGVVQRAFGSASIVRANVGVGGAWLARPTIRETDIPVCRCEVDEWSGEGCCDGCINRSMRYECLRGYCRSGSRCSNQQLQIGSSLETAVVDCGEKGVGLITLEPVEVGRLVGEYVGEVINGDEARRRGLIYRHARHAYMLRVSRDRVIDATRIGGLMRFVNNSCSPNCQMEKWNVGGEERCGVFAIRAVEAGEELTIDYQFESTGCTQAVRCLCGSPNCRGVIGTTLDQRLVRATTQSATPAVATTTKKATVQLTLDHFFS